MFKECPKCKSKLGVLVTVIERRGLAFNYNGEGLGDTDTIVLKELKTLECMECHHRFRNKTN